MHATKQTQEPVRDDLAPHLLPAFDEAAAALASGVSVLLHGAPGVGKTMIARRLRNHLGERSTTAKLNENQSVRRLCRLPDGTEVVPWRAPHHTCSPAGMLGGGRPVRPGEVSLAHGGLLFLDEVTEFSIAVLSAVKHVYRDEFIEVNRSAGHWMFPADFALLGASNPCPCGWYGHDTRACTCSPRIIERYLVRIPPEMFDLTIFVPHS